MKSYDVVAVAHDGELVCRACLKGHAERSVFFDWADAYECAEDDGYLSVVFAQDVEEGDVCGRCGGELV